MKEYIIGGVVTLVLVFSLWDYGTSIIAKEDRYRGHRAYPPAASGPVYYPSYPHFHSAPADYGNKYDPNMPEEVAKRIGTRLYHGSECEWVDSADDDANVVNHVYAFPVSNCYGNWGAVGGLRAQVVCTGTVRCRSKEDPSFTFYLEQVLCASSSDFCPSAKNCALHGGALDLLGTEIDASPSGSVIYYDEEEMVTPVEGPEGEGVRIPPGYEDPDEGDGG